MKKDNILSCVVGLVAGLVVGFMFANSVNQKGVAAPAASEMKANSNMPPGHPDIGSTGAPGGMQPGVQDAIEKAKLSPDDFEAQLRAAEAYYQIERFDDAITYLTAANKLKPDDREVIVHLGNANFDASHFEEAEKWYTTALAKKSDDVSVRTDLGLTFALRDTPNYDRAVQEFNRALDVDPDHIQALQNLTVAYTKKGDAAKASTSLTKLEGLDAKNTAIAKLKEDITNIGTK